MTKDRKNNINFPIAFTKMSGAGNDFIIIDHRQPFLTGVAMVELAKMACRRKFSVGADGLILIEDDSEVDFCWRFYNADGSLAEMCGNGARCAARFAYERKIAPTEMRFRTAAGIIAAQIVGEAVKIKLTPPVDLRSNQSLTIAGQQITAHHINTGVPHVVTFVENIAETPVVDMGRLIRNHELYQPAGANVNFVEMCGAGELHVRTYERGVEDETLACGTGAVASALIAAKIRQAQSPVRVITSGGDTLNIHFSQNDQDEVDEIYLEGAARIIYEGELTKDAII